MNIIDFDDHAIYSAESQSIAEETMNNFDYIVANDFDRAWLNFELDLPLKPGKNGKPNPFYIDRPATRSPN